MHKPVQKEVNMQTKWSQICVQRNLMATNIPDERQQNYRSDEKHMQLGKSRNTRISNVLISCSYPHGQHSKKKRKRKEHGEHNSYFRTKALKLGKCKKKASTKGVKVRKKKD